jgi:hypothetical protein
MTYIYGYKKLVSVVITITMGLTCCKKIITVDPPENQLISSEVFKTDASATSAMTGLYAKIMGSSSMLASGGLTFYPGMYADEIYNSISGSDDQFSQNSLSTNNNVLQAQFWAAGYDYIYQANAIIEGLNVSDGVTPQTKNQLLGEALFIRAFSHFYLTQLFGKVPLILTTDYQHNAQLPRFSVDSVMADVVSDLVKAISYLTPDYVTLEHVRPNKWAATALLARAYLYQRNYDGAIQAATAVIESGKFILVDDLNAVFLNNSQEAIWQLMPVITNQNTQEGSVLVPPLGVIPPYCLQKSLVNSFEPGDKRRTNWTATVSINGNDYIYPQKYKVKSSTVLTEYYVVLRLSEQYLIRAEAENQLGQPEPARADINKIRNRAGLLSITTGDQAALTRAIEQERRIELFCEWGHRWFDLKRTERAETILSLEKPSYWQAKDTLFPIPLLEIQRNPYLIQNPGYN